MAHTQPNGQPGGGNTAVALEDVSALNRNDARRELMVELRRLLADTDALLDRVKSLTGDAYTIARDELDRKVAMLRQRYDALTDQASARTQVAREQTDRYVHENPWQSIAIAAAAGAILGVAITRR